MGSPGGAEDKESTCNAGGPGSIPGSESFSAEGNGNLLHFFFPGEFHAEDPGVLQSMG